MSWPHKVHAFNTVISPPIIFSCDQKKVSSPAKRPQLGFCSPTRFGKAFFSTYHLKALIQQTLTAEKESMPNCSVTEKAVSREFCFLPMPKTWFFLRKRIQWEVCFPHTQMPDWLLGWGERACPSCPLPHLCFTGLKEIVVHSLLPFP